MFGGYIQPGGGKTDVTIESSGTIGPEAVVSGVPASGAVTGQAGGGYFVIASGTIGTFDIGSGAIVSGRIASGQIGSRHIGSGQLTGFELGSGAIVSGRIASGQLGSFHIASGQLTGFELGSGAIVSGRIASGQIGSFHIGSGQLTGFELGSGAIVSGRVASGQLGGFHIANGGIISGNLASGNVARQHLASGLLQGAIQLIMDGGGAVLTAGEKGQVMVPYACTINWVNLYANQSGQVAVGIYKDTYANFPPTSGDTITTSGVPIISGSWNNAYSGTTALSGWTTALAKGDVIGFSVISVSNCQRVTVALQVDPS